MKGIEVHVQLPAALHYWKEECINNSERPIRFVVPFTAPELARVALQHAAELAEKLGGEILLLAVRQVPFQLPLDRPDFQPEVILSHLESLIEGISQPVRIQLALTRDKKKSLRQLIPSTSVVVIATERRWRKTNEERLAGDLSRAGCTVSLISCTRDGKDESVKGTIASITPLTHSPRIEKVHNA